MSECAGQSVTVSKGGWTKDHSTLIYHNGGVPSDALQEVSTISFEDQILKPIFSSTQSWAKTKGPWRWCVYVYRVDSNPTNCSTSPVALHVVFGISTIKNPPHTIQFWRVI